MLFAWYVQVFVLVLAAKLWGQAEGEGRHVSTVLTIVTHVVITDVLFSVLFLSLSLSISISTSLSLSLSLSLPSLSSSS